MFLIAHVQRLLGPSRSPCPTKFVLVVSNARINFWLTCLTKYRSFVLIKLHVETDLETRGRSGSLGQVGYNSGRIGFHDQTIPIPSSLALPICRAMSSESSLSNWTVLLRFPGALGQASNFDREFFPLSSLRKKDSLGRSDVFLDATLDEMLKITKIGSNPQQFQELIDTTKARYDQ